MDRTTKAGTHTHKTQTQTDRQNNRHRRHIKKQTNGWTEQQTKADTQTHKTQTQTDRQIPREREKKAREYCVIWNMTKNERITHEKSEIQEMELPRSVSSSPRSAPRGGILRGRRETDGKKIREEMCSREEAY